MSYGVVFSGGGALGSWQVGALKALIDRHGCPPEYVSGSSAGAINAAAVTAGFDPLKLEQLWADLTPRKIFKKRFLLGRLLMAPLYALRYWSVPEGMLRAASGLSSVYDSAPLRGTLTNIFDRHMSDFVHSDTCCMFLATDLTIGGLKRYYHCRRCRLKDGEPIHGLDKLVDALVASSAIPILFPAMGSFADGGVLRNQPLMSLVAMAEECDPSREEPLWIYVLKPGQDRLPQAFDIPAMGQAVLSLWMNAGLDSDLRLLELLNISYGKQRYRCLVIEPSRDLAAHGGGLLAFGGPARVQKLVQVGEEDANLALARL